MKFEELVDLNNKMEYRDILMLEAMNCFDGYCIGMPKKDMPNAFMEDACAWIVDTYLEYVNACSESATYERSLAAFVFVIERIFKNNKYKTLEEMKKIDLDDIIFELN